MLIGWITLVVAVLALPQWTTLIPPGAIPFVACLAGVLALFLRWLGGGLGPNTLTVAGIITLATGILSVPELFALIPATWMPIVTMITSVLTLIARYVVGQTPSDPARSVNALFFND